MIIVEVVHDADKRNGKGEWIYIARSGMYHTVLYLQITPHIPRKRSPDGATTDL